MFGTPASIGAVRRRCSEPARLPGADRDDDLRDQHHRDEDRRTAGSCA